MTSLSSSTATMHLSDDGDASPKIPTKEEFLGMTVKQLKQILKERNVDCIGCSEKSHLVERVLETYHLPIVPPEEPKPEPEKPEPVDLSETSKKLETRVQELNGVIAGLDTELKEYYPKLKKAKGSQQNYLKQRVLMLMKKRKMYQQQVDNLLSQQFSVDQVAFTKEQIQNTIDTTTALKTATMAQKEAMEKIDFDQLEDLRDEMDDMMWETKQINDMLNRDYAVDVDEGELDAELQELDNEMFMEMMEKPKEKEKAPNTIDHYSQIMKNTA